MSETQQVWDDFGAILRGFIRRRVKDDHVADDLLQDVFVRIHDKIDTLTNEDRLSAWLFRIARNVVTDHYRRQTDDQLAQDEMHDESPVSEDNINEQVGQWLVDRIDQLPTAYREAVTLSELHGVRQTEIAKRIGLSESGAKSRVQRGRKMLKDKLLECCHFEFDRRGNVLDYAANDQCATCCGSANGKCS